MPTASYSIKESTPCASVLCGIGLVPDRMVMIVGNIPTLDSGAANEISVKKQKRAGEIAIENGLLTIFLNETASANLPQQFRVFHAGGYQFKDIPLRSAAGSPTYTIIFGSSTAGGAYQPGLSAYSILVKDQAQAFLGGPPLVYMATGETTMAEELGGAEMHTSVSNVGDAFAADQFEACRLARGWILTLPVGKNLASTVVERKRGGPVADGQAIDGCDQDLGTTYQGLVHLLEDSQSLRSV